MSSTTGTDIVLPMISQHNGQMITTGIVRKKSTPKMISAKRYFELYGQGDIRTQTFLKTLQQTLGDEHFETYEVLFLPFYKIATIVITYSRDCCAR